MESDPFQGIILDADHRPQSLETTLAKKLQTLKGQIQKIKDTLSADILGEDATEFPLSFKDQLNAIKQEFIGFTTEISEEPTIDQQVREGYKKQTCNLALEDYFNAESVDQDERINIQTMANAFLEKDVDREQRRTLKNQLHASLDMTTFYAVDDVDTTLNDQKTHTHVLQRLLLHVAHQEMQPLFNQLGSVTNRADLIKTLEDEVYSHIQIGKHKEIQSIPKSEKDRSVVTKYFMNSWVGLKNSPIVNSVFKEYIDQIDTDLYQMFLNQSLLDGQQSFAFCLQYYPTPDALRNLLLLSAASERDYEELAATAISKIARNKNWPLYLERFVQMYPSAESAIPLLKTWKFDQYNRPNTIQPFIADFTKSLVTDPSQPDNVVKIAQNLLPQDYALEQIVAMGILTTEQKQLFTDAIAILEEDTNATQPNHKVNSQDLNEALTKYTAQLLDNTTDYDTRDMSTKNLKLLLRLAQHIKDNRSDHNGLYYLSSDSLIRKITSAEIDEQNMELLLTAYKTAPILLDNPVLIIDIEQFLSEDRLQLLNKIQDLAPQLLTPTIEGIERLFMTFGGVFIRDESDLRFINTFLQGNMNDVDEHTDISMGRKIFDIEKSKIKDEKIKIEVGNHAIYTDAHIDYFSDLKLRLTSGVMQQIPNIIDHIDTLVKEEVTPETWYKWLIIYTSMINNHRDTLGMKQEDRDAINERFESPQTKNVCLTEYRKLWRRYLHSTNYQDIPFSLNALSLFISHHEEEAGNLKHINALTSMARTTTDMLVQSDDDSFNQNVYNNIAKLETMFEKHKWTYEDMTYFYTTATSIMNLDPALFGDMSDLLSLLNKETLLSAIHDLLPLYHVHLSLLPQTNVDGKTGVDGTKLQGLRDQIKVLTTNIQTKPVDEQTSSMQTEKQRLIQDIRGQFKDNYGITKIPEDFTDEALRSIRNIGVYLANISEKDETKEKELALYLALLINNHWQTFREGGIIPLDEYFNETSLPFYQDLIRSRTDASPLQPQALGITQEDLPEFQKILQAETSNLAIGTTQTIDTKLSSVIGALRDLCDEDVYPERIDKQLLQLLLKYKSGPVNKVLNKLYQQINGRPVVFDDSELEIQKDIQELALKNGIGWQLEAIKELQRRAKPIALTTSVYDHINNIESEREILQLRELLHPNEEVIHLFKKLGEEFTPSSGAMALSHDLSNLETIIVKRGNELSSEETQTLQSYLNSIRGQIQKLEQVLASIKQKCDILVKNPQPENNDAYANRISEIDKALKTTDSLQTINTTMTHDLNEIIENIRACLGCLGKEVNNDTNLSFGDSNKFLVLSKAESQEGAIADQIIFVEPIQYGETQEIAFVFDQIYGLRSSDIIINHINTVLKTYRQILTKFPDCKISVCITDACVASSGLSSELLSDQLIESLRDDLAIDRLDEIEIDVVPSVLSDHYIEFGEGEAREAGKRKTGGLVISKKIQKIITRS